MLKKTMLAAVTGAALLASNAAFADRDHYRHGHQRHGVVKHVKHHYVEHRPVVHHYYRPQYQPVRHVVVHHRPAPVYYQPYQPIDHTGAVIFAGAVLGAVIGHHIATGY